MLKRFQIGAFPFSLRYPEEIAPPENFLRFEVSQGDAAFSYEMSLVDALLEPEGAPIAQRPDLQVYRSAQGEMRLLALRGRPGPFACYRETGPGQAEILLLRGRVPPLLIDPTFTGLLALEGRMLERDSLILHCAYIQFQGKAILFSAPSETGKTTQAGLWERYQHSRTVNGDRALLRQVDGGWIADGWPVCGTSEVCHNEKAPIHAIVMLRQAAEDRARRLRPAEAFMQIYAQITVNGWDRDSVAKASALIERLVTEVPVYALGCTISETAVDCLKAALYP